MKCRSCAKGETATDKTRCQKCLDKHNKWAKRRHGLCMETGCNNPVAETTLFSKSKRHVLCKKCLNRKNIYTREYKRQEKYKSRVKELALLRKNVAPSPYSSSSTIHPRCQT